MTPAPPPGAIVFEGAAVPLLIVHAVLGFAAVGGTTHHAVYAILVALGRKRLFQLTRFGWIAPLAVGAQVLLGLALYPTYRVRVRALHLDLTAPQLAQLFDFKEHLAALALVITLGVAAAGRALARDAALDGLEPSGPGLARGLAALSVLGALLVWTVALIGLVVTARHPLGMP